MKVEEKFVETEFGKICYLDIGNNAKTLIFFHGFLGQPIQDERWVKKLAGEGWRVILPYLPGHGKSFEMPQGFNFSKLTLTMTEFVEKVAPQNIALMGHSFLEF